MYEDGIAFPGGEYLSAKVIELSDTRHEWGYIIQIHSPEMVPEVIRSTRIYDSWDEADAASKAHMTKIHISKITSTK